MSQQSGGQKPNAAAAGAIQRAIGRALAYLVDQQDKDGGWHSQAYGSMRGGAAITAIVIDAISRVPEKLRAVQAKSLAAGLQFICANVDVQGCPRCPDRSVDYPTYAAVLAIAAIARSKVDPDPRARKRMLDYTLAIQLTEARGFTEKDVNHGGWELTGDLDMRNITTGSNVSITAYALDALASERGDKIDAARRHALAWLARCQNFYPTGDGLQRNSGDGGFFFQAERKNDANKAQWADEDHRMPRSYGTATSDGLRGLLAAGVKPTDAPAAAAIQWLTSHNDIAQVPGFEKAPVGLGWPQGLRFYYYCGLSKIFDALPQATREARRDAIAKALTTAQQKDGSWANDSHHMRENDPLIATSFALETLARCLPADDS